MFGFTLFPIFGLHILKHGLKDVIDKSSKATHGVLIDLSKEYLLVICCRLVDGSVKFCIPHEEHALTTKFYALAYSK